MIIYIGADHKGFQLKKQIVELVKSRGYEVADMGNAVEDQNDDYPDFAVLVAEKVNLNYENARGILLCGSGVGVDIVANKFRNIRSALVCTPDQAFDSRNDDDTNILSLPADYITPEGAGRIVTTWLETPFSGEDRYRRRLQKVYDIERKNIRQTSADSS